ncbi:MAG: hypothetical protein ACK46G_06515 [Flavobacteriales bacterium]
MSKLSWRPCLLRTYAILMMALHTHFTYAQDKPAFDFRMVFTHPATESAYAAEHRIRQVIKTRDSEDASSSAAFDILNFGSYESKP